MISQQQMSLKELNEEIRNVNSDMYFRLKDVKTEYAAKIAILEKAIKEHPDTIKAEKARNTALKTMRKELKRG